VSKRQKSDFLHNSLKLAPKIKITGDQSDYNTHLL
jgi:hypothetical protein